MSITEDGGTAVASVRRSPAPTRPAIDLTTVDRNLKPEPPIAETSEVSSAPAVKYTRDQYLSLAFDALVQEHYERITSSEDESGSLLAAVGDYADSIPETAIKEVLTRRGVRASALETAIERNPGTAVRIATPSISSLSAGPLAELEVLAKVLQEARERGIKNPVGAVYKELRQAIVGLYASSIGEELSADAPSSPVIRYCRIKKGSVLSEGDYFIRARFTHPERNWLGKEREERVKLGAFSFLLDGRGITLVPEEERWREPLVRAFGKVSDTLLSLGVYDKVSPVICEQSYTTLKREWKASEAAMRDIKAKMETAVSKK